MNPFPCSRVIASSRRSSIPNSHRAGRSPLPKATSFFGPATICASFRTVTVTTRAFCRRGSSIVCSKPSSPATRGRQAPPHSARMTRDSFEVAAHLHFTVNLDLRTYCEPVRGGARLTSWRIVPREAPGFKQSRRLPSMPGHEAREEIMDNADIRQVAVIGAGTIGASWAAFFLSRGLSVAASDPAPQADATLRRFVAASWPALVRLGASQPVPDKVPEDRLSFHCRTRGSAGRCRFRPGERSRARGGEARAAGPARRRAALRGGHRLEFVRPADEPLAGGLPSSERCVIGHPFNPPHLVPLVEVVAGNDTAPATVERALAFYAAIGKRPIRIHREVAGHVANRLQAALWREAVHLVTEGVAHGGRHRHRDQRRAGHALGPEGAVLDLSPGRRQRRHRAFPRPIRRSHGSVVGDPRLAPPHRGSPRRDHRRGCGGGRGPLDRRVGGGARPPAGRDAARMGRRATRRSRHRHGDLSVLSARDRAIRRPDPAAGVRSKRNGGLGTASVPRRS